MLQEILLVMSWVTSLRQCYRNLMVDVTGDVIGDLIGNVVGTLKGDVEDCEWRGKAIN